MYWGCDMWQAAQATGHMVVNQQSQSLPSQSLGFRREDNMNTYTHTHIVVSTIQEKNRVVYDKFQDGNLP